MERFKPPVVADLRQEMAGCAISTRRSMGAVRYPELTPGGRYKGVGGSRAGNRSPDRSGLAPAEELNKLRRRRSRADGRLKALEKID